MLRRAATCGLGFFLENWINDCRAARIDACFLQLPARDPRRVEPVKHFICAAFQACRFQQQQIEKNGLPGSQCKKQERLQFKIANHHPAIRTKINSNVAIRNVRCRLFAVDAFSSHNLCSLCQLSRSLAYVRRVVVVQLRDDATFHQFAFALLSPESSDARERARRLGIDRDIRMSTRLPAAPVPPLLNSAFQIDQQVTSI
jgi:hypothetical protein